MGHSLLILRDGHGQTLWKHPLGWKYRLETTNSVIAAKTLLPDGQTRMIFFDSNTGQPSATKTFVDLTGFSPLRTPAPLSKSWHR